MGGEKLKMKHEKIKNLIGELLEEMLNGDLDTAIKGTLEDAMKMDCKISIEKDKQGRAHTRLEGNSLAILVTLAGLEKIVLDKLDCNNRTFEILKRMIDQEDAK